MATPPLPAPAEVRPATEPASGPVVVATADPEATVAVAPSAANPVTAELLGRLRPTAAAFVDLAWRAPAVAAGRALQVTSRLLEQALPSSQALVVLALLLAGGWAFSRMSFGEGAYPLRL